MAAAVSPASGSPTDAKNAFPKQTQTVDCGNGDTIQFKGATKLWPPNHKYRTVTITVTESHPVPYNWTDTVGSSESDNGLGDGNTVDDAMPPAGGGGGLTGGSTSQDHLLRAERSGNGDGRTYSIDVSADFDGGANHCEHTFTVTVPHDMRGGRFN